MTAGPSTPVAAGVAVRAPTDGGDAAGGPLVFPTHKSGAAERTPHAWGCYRAGAALVWPDGTTAAMRSKASNRCPGCARAAAFENMTMLRIDAEENDAPELVLTLTSRRADLTSKEYGAACAVFWRAFRRRYGQAVQYCGFIEWTTGDGPRSGGVRRLHSHWLVKLRGVTVDVLEAQAWCSMEWARLTGAWVVELAELRSAGGIVGYLALHHEKMEQAPPAGWTGRRLRPSKGYFAVPGETRRERARLWLAQHREMQREWPRELPPEKPRVVWSRPEWDRDADAAAAEPGRSFDSLPARRELDRRLSDYDAPANLDELSALARFEQQELEAMRRGYRRQRLRALELERHSRANE